MHTKIHPDLAGRPEIDRAKEILTGCVHCGFCTDTCPSYQVLGDELDSPRGRIYLIRGLLETGQAHQQLQTHLDQCLTCRACETACPSGVEYGELLEVGRSLAEKQLRRGYLQSLLRWGLCQLVARPRVFALLLRAAAGWSWRGRRLSCLGAVAAAQWRRGG